MDKYVGKRLDGRYEIEEIIGIGGMAVVYKAHDNIENRTVAIKILKDEFVSNDEFIRRFKNESRAISMLSHPNIVKVYDVSFGDLIQYIVMEYISGVTLKEYIEHKGCLRWKDAVYFTIQILKALQHAHDKGIVHRDVKPQNIMVLQDGSIKVTDFGIARFSRSEQRTITDKAIGSVHYISPEQAKGEKTDEKADVYSVGVMLYEMLTGRLPFDAERAVSVAIMQLQSNPKLPTEINPSIPLGLEQITMHAMQKLTERRYQSAAEMLCDLERFRKDPEVTFGYTYFVDNSPTKFVNTPVVAPVVPNVNEIPQNPEIPDEPEEEKKSGSTIPVLAGIATALIAVLVILGVIFIPRLFQSGEDVECPDFTGMTQEEVKKSEHYKTFTIEFEEKITEDESKVGKVIDQNPKIGKKVKKSVNTRIILYFGALEGENLTVPNIYGMPKDQAVRELKALGLDYISDSIESDDSDADTVIKTDPKVGTKVKKNDKIRIYIGTGKANVPIQVPDVVTFKQDSAKDTLKDAGFTNVKTELVPITKDFGNYFNNNFKGSEGYVVSQDPAKDTSTSRDTQITLKVSNGTVNTNVKFSFDAESFIDNMNGA
ncbi:MAG: Stk1 family PASTA domain-containing Ser/Thr kinase, partial [Clostridia bacterium]|nr:Stk1 family PASTA domain-containing Ser/Thr kinase [Clostridia bacterium]